VSHPATIIQLHPVRTPPPNENALNVYISTSDNDVRNLVDEVCDDLRIPATDRISQRYIVDELARNDRRAGVAEANRQAREVVEAAWPTLETRLSILPGKTLLSKIRQVVQSTFGASFGNERLAEAFRKEEIPGEIAGILKAVADLQGRSVPS
jgi:hypothetical protein